MPGSDLFTALLGFGYCVCRLLLKRTSIYHHQLFAAAGALLLRLLLLLLPPPPPPRRLRHLASDLIHLLFLRNIGNTAASTKAIHRTTFQ